MLKEDKFIDFNEEHPSNIEVILLTEEVSNSSKLIYCKFLQFKNMAFIDVTLEESKFEKSTSTSVSISKNILSITTNLLSYSILTLYIPSSSILIIPILSMVDLIPFI